MDSATFDDDSVFKALADGTRRAVLDALFAKDGQTVAELCAQFPQMTRFGVMKHLAVLEDANLLVTRRAGRTKLHHLNAVPIAQISNRWVGKFARPITQAMLDVAEQLTLAAPQSTPTVAAPQPAPRIDPNPPTTKEAS